MIKTYSFALLLSCLFYASTAEAKVRADSNYIREFPGTMTVRVFLSEKISNFRIVDVSRGENLQYRPNNVLSIGAGVTVRGIGLNFSAKLPYHDPKESQYGKTKRLDVQLHNYRRKLAMDIYFQRYQGFHLNDPADVTMVQGPTTYPYFANLRSLTFGGSAMYVPGGQKLSLRSLINQQDWQIRSAGSWMVGGTIFTHFLSNKDSSIVPENRSKPDFLDSGLFKHIDVYGLTANLGYGYNLVLNRHWLIGLSGDVGVGGAYSSTKDLRDQSEGRFGFLLNTNVRFGAGYNSAKWFGGFYAIYRTDIYSLPLDQSKLRISEGVFRVVLARRLKIGTKSLLAR